MIVLLWPRYLSCSGDKGKMVTTLISAFVHDLQRNASCKKRLFHFAVYAETTQVKHGFPSENRTSKHDPTGHVSLAIDA